MWRAARRWIRGYESSNTPAQSAPRNSRRFTESAPIFFRSGRRRRPPTAIAGTPAHVAGRSDSKSQSLRRPRTPDSGLSRQARSPPRMSPAIRHSRAMDPTLLAESDPRDRYVLVPGFADYWLCRLPRGNLLVYGSLPADAWATNSRWQTALCRPCTLGMQPQTARLRRG